MSLNIKACLIPLHDEDEEIRRFSIPAHFSTHSCFLKMKIVELYPRLKMGNYQIFWTDSEGDQIAFSKDNELALAISSVTDGELRIEIKEMSLHPDVVCNSCEQEIVTRRFTCSGCKNYDLCGPCKDKGIHSKHPLKFIESKVRPKEKIRGADYKCRICKCPIYEIRFKCKVCQNFNLCRLCKNEGLHSQHALKQKSVTKKK